MVAQGDQDGDGARPGLARPGHHQELESRSQSTLSPLLCSLTAKVGSGAKQRTAFVGKLEGQSERGAGDRVPSKAQSDRAAPEMAAVSEADVRLPLTTSGTWNGCAKGAAEVAVGAPAKAERVEQALAVPGVHDPSGPHYRGHILL